MSADKRSVHTDALATLGFVIDSSQERDAIHLAVDPIEAAEVLYPGQRIGIVDGKATSKAPKILGIVDPFLLGPVYPGQFFWLIVSPRTISSLRHVWSHPDFEEKKSDVKISSEIEFKNFEVIEEPKAGSTYSTGKLQVDLENEEDVAFVEDYKAKKKRKAESREWVENFAGQYGISFSRIMDGAAESIGNGAYIVGGAELEGERVPYEFWEHYEILTETQVDEEHKSNFFTCGCG